MEKMKEVNGALYSRHEFATYEYRVKVRFTLLDGNDDTSFDIYTSETDKDKIRKSINDMLNREKCITFKVENYSTKAQDDLMTKFLDETLKDI